MRPSKTPSNRRRGPAAWLLLLLLLGAPSLSGCHVHSFRVGIGGNNIGQETMQQYYLFFGLINLNNVDIQRVVGDLTSYDVETGFSYRDGFWTTLGDAFVSACLLPFTITRRAVTVRY